MNLPREVLQALALLHENGYEAFVVGGCVRDAIMGRAETDFDLTSSALPQEVCAVFAGYKVIETGLKHGTVTVVMGDMALEITSYRIDGTYTDKRHPDSVSFTRSLREDLARRDFTMNAICYNAKEGYIDCFGGMQDIANRKIRAVGDANQRFCEDALRMLRAIRFSAVLGFDIEAGTAAAIHENKALLRGVAVERIAVELNKILCSANVVRIFQEFVAVFAVFMPELLPMVHFQQNNKHHCFDVFTHSLVACQSIADTLHLRLAMLLHDIGKPASYTCTAGVGHFYAHAKESALLAEKILARLHYDTETKQRVLCLVQHHDLPMQQDVVAVKRYLSKFGAEIMLELLQVQCADCKAQHPDYHERLAELAQLQAMVLSILQEKACFTIKTLAVSGRDLMALGMPQGRIIGQALQYILDAVISGAANNTHDDLLPLAKRWYEKKHRKTEPKQGGIQRAHS